MNLPTYTAKYADTGQIIYTKQSRGNLVGELPAGTFPVAHPASTLERSDGGDPFEYAMFRTSPAARMVTITRDPEPAPLEVVVIYDEDGVKVLSNCKTLPVIIRDLTDRDPENTDCAAARLDEERLHIIDEAGH